MPKENDNFPKKKPYATELSPASGFEVLIRRISEGSDAAVWELLDQYSTNILRVVRRHLPTELRPKVDSTDIVQSVWKSLLRKGHAFDHIGSAAEFVGYIAGAARNKVFEAHRHFTRLPRFDIRREIPMKGISSQVSAGDHQEVDCIDPRSADPAELANAREIWELALQKAGERGKRIVQLRLQGMTFDEIADETGVSKNTVRRDLASLLVSLTS